MSEADLWWYFGTGQGIFQHSTTGSTLERAELFSVDESGARIQRPRTIYLRDEEGRVVGSEEEMHVRPTRNGHFAEDAAIVRRDVELRRFARISRAIDAVELALREPLAAYFGDIGDRWAREPVGRIFAVYPLTAAGARILSDRDTLGVRSDLRLFNTYEAQRRNPSNERKRLFALADDEARDRVRRGLRKYSAAAKAERERSRAYRQRA